MLSVGVTIYNGGEFFFRPGFKIVQRLWPNQYQPHNIGRVVFFIERDQLVSNLAVRAIPQCVLAANRKVCSGMLGIVCAPPCSKMAPPVVA